MASNEIDNIANYKQQPRGPPPRRRTDFSIFHCPSSSGSEASPDALVGTSSCAGDGLPGVAQIGLNNVDGIGKGSPWGSTLVPCSNWQDHTTHHSNGHLTLTDKVDSGEQDELVGDRDWSTGTREHDASLTSESHAASSSGGCFTPCSNVRDHGAPNGSQVPSKHASKEKVYVRSRRQLFKSPVNNNVLNPQQESSGRLTLSNSTDLEDESSERGRGKRKRKPKIPFDEESNLPLKSARKSRRFRIMRYLGLMAPVGSPF